MTMSATSPATRDWAPLTDAQQSAYDEQGYLHLREVFSAEEVERGLKVIDELSAARAPTIEEHASFLTFDHTMRVRNAVAHTAGLDYFLDHPKLIGPLMTLLNGNIHVLGTDVIVRAVRDEVLEPWHTDGGEYLQRYRLAAGSPNLQVKAQIFLTDVTQPNSGNFLLVPGSHREPPSRQTFLCEIPELDEPTSRGELPPQAVQVMAKAGDVLLFPYSLWHAVAPNRTRPRKTFIFRYGQLWHRPHDYLLQPPEVLNRMSPRLRRMFGGFGDKPHPSDFYKPVDQQAVMAVGGSDVG
jgi:ectoine hydroxylase-related dioxygenase (phytanoyl-CoA dioxygenase family)